MDYKPKTNQPVSKLNENPLSDFIDSTELTKLSNEDSILLEGMVGTSGTNIVCFDAYCPRKK